MYVQGILPRGTALERRMEILLLLARTRARTDRCGNGQSGTRAPA